MTCLEPNQIFFRIARHNCRTFPNVIVHNLALEEWPITPKSFDAVMAASAFHWVTADVAYSKAAEALVDGGYLILLWNMTLLPANEVNKMLLPVYERHDVGFIHPEAESLETQDLNITKFGENIIDSGLFKDLTCYSETVRVTYSVDDYLLLLSTYSKYLALPPEIRNKLFHDMKKVIVEQFGENLDLTYKSACHIARKACELGKTCELRSMFFTQRSHLFTSKITSLNMAKPDLLKPYRQKRNFSVTSEPSGTDKRTKSQAALSFVVQKHWASRLHYDLRLELDGTMKSWAVPKGPSSDPNDKRMAVHVEDHPISYNTFEGEIPPGQYGAGKVIIWDKGIWVPLEDPHKGYRDGKLKFELHGHKLKGPWALVRMRNKDETEAGCLAAHQGKGPICATCK